MPLPNYCVKYQVDFAARNGDLFRAEVLEEDYDGDIHHLIGAESPFETEEDNTEDPFAPIRRQTGVLRIADNGFDLEGNEFDYKDLFPTNCFDYQVRLWQVGETDTLRWIGYILDGTLTSSLFDKIPIREYQLSCPLGMLYNLPLNFSNNQTNKGTAPTFGQFMYNALKELYIDWQYVHKTNNVPGRADLTSRVSLLNFCQENEPSISGSGETYSATWTDKNTFGDTLQEICLFWGWTLMTRGLDIYIIARGQNRPFATFAFSDLTSTNMTLDEYTTILSDGNVNYVDTDELTYVSKDHTESALNGKKNIEIIADVNAKDDVISPDMRKLDYDFIMNGSSPIHINNDFRYVMLKTQSQYATGFFNLENYRLRIIETVITGVNSPIVVMQDSWKFNEDKASFSMKECVNIWQGNGAGDTISYSVETAEDILIPSDSMISIAATAKPSQDPTSSDTFPTEGLVINLAMRVGQNTYYLGTVGAYDPDTNKHTYNGGWQTGAASFKAVLNSGGNIELSRGELDPYNGASGYCIHVPKDESVPQGMCGRLKFEVHTLGGLSGAAYPNFKASLVNFKIGIYVKDDVIQPKCKDSQIYKGIASEDFREDLDLSLSMASGNKNKYGLGQVYDVNFNLLTQVPYVNGNDTWDSLAPEERLLSRLRSVYSSVIQQCTIEVEDNLQASLPDNRFDISWRDGEVFTMLACAHNWRDATMKLTLINK